LARQVVLSLEDKYDEKLRRLAKDLFDGRKGAMSDVVEKGLDLVEEESKRDKAYTKLLKKVRNARAVGIGTFKREEAYAR